MISTELLQALLQATAAEQVESAIEALRASQPDIGTMPFGRRENNRGIIEVSTDPGRSLIERVTNGIDAVLEQGHDEHGGIPAARTPKEAAAAWLGVPNLGLSEMTANERRTLARHVQITLLEGEGKAARTVEIRDAGIGLSPAMMPDTILSLNESNKIQKHYLAGTYGQGGSSTLAVSKFTVIASRAPGSAVGFTVAFFQDLPPEQYKTGRYVYLALSGTVLEADVPDSEFPVGTVVRHIGYDLSNYGSPLGPNSVYGLLNQVLFDPILPVWLDNHIHHYRRVIKGSRNALNGATDEGDDSRGPSLTHRMPLFYVNLGDFGRIGIEYWVLSRPAPEATTTPIAAFVNPKRPIVLTINGQTHAELPQSLV